MYANARASGLGMMALCDVEDHSGDPSMMYDSDTGCWISVDDSGSGGVRLPDMATTAVLTPTVVQTQAQPITMLPAPVIIGSTPPVPPNIVMLLGLGALVWYLTSGGR